MPLFKTPRFWYPDKGERPSLCGILLRPLSCVYALGHRLNMAYHRPFRASVPVVCIGNIVAGGSGKTPVSLALMKLIQDRKLVKSPYFLTRGYGGSIAEATRVDSKQHNAAQVGDETLLLARQAPVIKSVERDRGAVLAQDKEASLILMDDGFQNQSLHKDLSILVIDGETGLGNGALLPAGPLRESLSDAIKRTSAVVFLGQDQHDIASRLPNDIPVFHAGIVIDKKPQKDLPYIAFCGLARPEKFFETLEKLGLNIVQCHAYADHHHYTQDELNELVSIARNEKATLITTEKDIVKLQALSGAEDVQTLPISLKWDDEDAVYAFLQRELS